jgi:two-component system OmpR family response regulator
LGRKAPSSQHVADGWNEILVILNVKRSLISKVPDETVQGQRPVQGRATDLSPVLSAVDRRSDAAAVRPDSSGSQPDPREGVTILLLDEDESWRTRAAAALYRRGYDVMSQADRWRIAEMLNETAPDLVVLSADSPERDARLSKLLTYWPPPPRLLLLCPPDLMRERAASLTAGANECMPKPRDPEGLCDTIDQMLPSLAIEPGRGEVLEFEGWRLFPLRGKLMSPSGASTFLAAGDLQLLRVFLARRGRLLNRVQLHRLCRIDDGITEQVLVARVCRLRRTLRRLEPGARDLIKTVWGEGYVFVAKGRKPTSRKRSLPSA